MTSGSAPRRPRGHGHGGSGPGREPQPSQVSSGPLDTIIVAPDLMLEVQESEARLARARRERGAPTVRVTAVPSADKEPKPRAALASASLSAEAQATRSSRRPHRSAPQWLMFAALGTALVGVIVWSQLDVSRAAYRTRAELTRPMAIAQPLAGAGVSSHAALRVTPMEKRPLAATPSLDRQLSFSNVHVVWGRAERPMRSLRAALRRSTTKVLSCVKLAPATPSSVDTLMLSLRIDPDGDLIWARPNGDPGDLRPFIPCIADALRGTEFPPSLLGLRVDAGLKFRAR